MTPETLQIALSKAWKRKEPLLEATDAVRLLNGEASDTPRLVLELYGKHAIFYDYGSGQEALLHHEADGWMQTYGWDSLSRLDRAVAGDEGRIGNHVLAGEVPETLIVHEGNLQFRLEPKHPRNVGLFLDTRELRKSLGAMTRGARVLNLFAYTGSLGLAALAGGALEVTQVDISARYLDWARANVRLNSFPETSCRFSRMDSERYLDWAAKKALRFDHIILDPPVFSRFEGKVFRWADDYFRLAEKSAALLAPGGTLHAVTNYSDITAADFSARLQDAVFAANPSGRRQAAAPQPIPLPPDFDLAPDAVDRPEGNALIFQITVE